MDYPLPVHARLVSPSPAARVTDRRATFVILATWVVAIVLVAPLADVPLIDDWVYAISVERILGGHGFSVSPWSSTFPAVQIWWGTLFATLAGFSYTTLRSSTLLLAAGGLLAFYRLLRALAVDAAPALLAALALALYPVAFFLSFTFMTDVPLVAVTCASLWALAVGLRDDAPALLGMGVALAVAAFLIRPVAIALPAALVLAGLLHPTPAVRRRALVLAVGSGLAMVGAAGVAARLWPRAGEGGLAYRVDRLRWLFLVSPWVYLEAALSMLAHLGLAVLPVVLATAPPPRRWPWRTAAGLVAAGLVVSAFAPQAVTALRPEHTWSAEEIGATRPLLEGFPAPAPLRVALAAAATVAGLVAAACVAGRVGDALAPGGAVRRPDWICVAAFGVASVGLCFVLWFFYDRYYLPLVPVALALAVVPTTRVTPIRWPVAVAALGLLFVLDVTGTRDTLAFARAVSAATDGLHARGVAYHDLDAGYVENGWRLYAHPENLPPGAVPERDVTHVTADEREPWVLAMTPLAGYVVRETIAVPTWWTAHDRLYVLERNEDAPPP